MARRPRLILALLVVTGLVIGTAPALGLAPPQPVCAVCTNALDDAATEHGLTVDRGESDMDVQLFRNGSARVEARVTLDEGAEALEDDALREAIVSDVRYRVFEDLDHRSSQMQGDTLVVTYLARDVSHETLGVVRFDAFVARDPPPLVSGGEGTHYPGADRLQLKAPPGYEVHGSPGDRHSGTAVEWDGDSHTQFGDPIDRDLVLSFTSRGTFLPGARVWLAGIIDWVSSLW